MKGEKGETSIYNDLWHSNDGPKNGIRMKAFGIHNCKQWIKSSWACEVVDLYQNNIEFYTRRFLGIKWINLWGCLKWF